MPRHAEKRNPRVCARAVLPKLLGFQRTWRSSGLFAAVRELLLNALASVAGPCLGAPWLVQICFQKAKLSLVAALRAAGVALNICPNMSPSIPCLVVGMLRFRGR